MSVEALRCESESPRLPIWWGDTARLGCVFSTIDAGASVDPDQVSFMIRAPDGIETTLVYGLNEELERVSAGVYRVDFDFTQSGVWRYRFQAQGKNSGVTEGQVTVKASGVVTG